MRTCLGLGGPFWWLGGESRARRHRTITSYLWCHYAQRKVGGVKVRKVGGVTILAGETPPSQQRIIRELADLEIQRSADLESGVRIPSSRFGKMAGNQAQQIWKNGGKMLKSKAAAYTQQLFSVRPDLEKGRETY